MSRRRAARRRAACRAESPEQGVGGARAGVGGARVGAGRVAEGLAGVPGAGFRLGPGFLAQEGRMSRRRAARRCAACRAEIPEQGAGGARAGVGGARVGAGRVAEGLAGVPGAGFRLRPGFLAQEGRMSRRHAARRRAACRAEIPEQGVGGRAGRSGRGAGRGWPQRGGRRGAVGGRSGWWWGGPAGGAAGRRVGVPSAWPRSRPGFLAQEGRMSRRRAARRCAACRAEIPEQGVGGRACRSGRGAGRGWSQRGGRRGAVQGRSAWRAARAQARRATIAAEMRSMRSYGTGRDHGNESVSVFVRCGSTSASNGPSNLGTG